MKKNAIWITGASAGIGKSLAIKFNNEGHLVIGSSRRKEVIESLNSESESLNKIITLQNDVRKYKDIENLVNQLSENHNINCLINNAGVTSFKPFVENSIDEIEEIIDTNLKGAIFTIKSVLPNMIKMGEGIIINILSVAASKIFTNSSIYAASKAGLETYSKVLREELREKNIKIVNIYPGATATEIWPQKSLEKFSNKMMTTDNLATFIYDVYKNCNNLSPEEIVVRPITGDL